MADVKPLSDWLHVTCRNARAVIPCEGLDHDTTRILAIGTLAILGFSVAAGGHHSFAAYYFEDQSIEIEGEIVEVQFKAPHTWVHVNTRETSGKEKRVCRGVGQSEPARTRRDDERHVEASSDVVRIWGSPSRDPNDGRIHLKRIVRPSDGWEWRPRRSRSRTESNCNRVITGFFLLLRQPILGGARRCW